MSPAGAGVTPADLKNRLVHIVGERNPWTAAKHLASVEAYIEREFAGLGLRVENDVFSYRGRSYRNIIGRAGARGAPLTILGAHIDCVQGSPGADDNASGVAVLLEAARRLASMKHKSELLFCAFNLEEHNMIGSSHLAKRLKADGAKITGMVSLEMLGYTDHRPGSQQYPAALRWLYPDRGDFVGVVGNWRSAALLRSFAAALKKIDGLPVETLSVFGNGFLVPQTRLSDHAPFWDAGYPALLLTDTAFMRNPHYHASSDSIETLDLDFMAKICQGVVNAVALV